MKIKLLLSLNVIFQLSCASYMPGNQAQNIGEETTAQMSMESDADLSTKYSSFYSITFHNPNNEYLRIKSVDVEFEKKDFNERAMFSVGKDLQSWAEGIQHKVRVDRHNEAVVMSAVMLTGAALVSSDSSSTSTVGATAYIGALSAVAYNDMRRGVKKVEIGKIVPEGHLFNTPFTIAPGLYKKKWLLVNEAWHRLQNGDLFITLEDISGKVHRFKVSMF